MNCLILIKSTFISQLIILSLWIATNEAYVIKHRKIRAIPDKHGAKSDSNRAHLSQQEWVDYDGTIYAVDDDDKNIVHIFENNGDDVGFPSGSSRQMPYQEIDGKSYPEDFEDPIYVPDLDGPLQLDYLREDDYAPLVDHPESSVKSFPDSVTPMFPADDWIKDGPYQIIRMENQANQATATIRSTLTSRKPSNPNSGLGNDVHWLSDDEDLEVLSAENGSGNLAAPDGGDGGLPDYQHLNDPDKDPWRGFPASNGQKQQNQLASVNEPILVTHRNGDWPKAGAGLNPSRDQVSSPSVHIDNQENSIILAAANAWKTAVVTIMVVSSICAVMVVVSLIVFILYYRKNY